MTDSERKCRLEAIAVLMQTADDRQMLRLQEEVDSLIGFSSDDEEYELNKERLGAWESISRVRL